MGVISRNMELAPPPPGAPGMFRCGNPGLMKGILEKAGFNNIEEQEINKKIIYENADHMWTMMNEVAAPVVAALSKADEAVKEKIKNEVKESSQKYMTDKGLEMDFGSLILSAKK
jgi:hypothetical protein